MKPLSRSQSGLWAVAIAVPIVFLSSAIAAAQQQNRDAVGSPLAAPAPPIGTAQTQAPVGHRQPSLNSLPPSIRKDEETSGNRPRDALGPVPSICSKC